MHRVSREALHLSRPGHRTASCLRRLSQMAATKRALVELQFDNSFTRELPGDSNTTNTRRQVLGASYSLVEPTPAEGEPTLLAASTSAAALLDLDEAELKTRACACARLGLLSSV